MRRENYKSDLRVAVQLVLGGEPIAVPEHDFLLRFSTTCFMSDHHYDCKRVGDVWTNCYEQDGKVICCLNNHRFSPGRLRVEYFDYAPASDFPDGNMLKVVPRCLDIELVNGAGDDAAMIEAEVAIDIAGAVAAAEEAAGRANTIAADLEAKRDADYWRGEKGEKGDTFTYADMTEADKEDLAGHVDAYTKSESDGLLAGKADVSDIPDVSGFVEGSDLSTINSQSLTRGGNIVLPTTADVAAAINLALSDYYAKSESDGRYLPQEVTVSTSGDVTQAMASNTFYKFGEVDSLTLTLVAASAGLAIYGGKFTASANWSALNVPAEVTLAADCATVAAGNTYEFNILDNVLMMVKI